MTNVYTEGELIKLGNEIDENFIIIKGVRRGTEVYDFIELGKEGFIKDFPLRYIYSINKGNVYLEDKNNWSKQELRSNSHAFNKGNPNKMAVPNDVLGAGEFILNHYLKKRKRELKESLDFNALIPLKKLTKTNSTFREFTNYIFDVLRKEIGTDQAVNVMEWSEEELQDLYNKGISGETIVNQISKGAFN